MDNRRVNVTSNYVNITGGQGGSGGRSDRGAAGDGGPGGSVFMSVSSEPPFVVFDFLKPYVVWGALYNSAKREKDHAVTCQPETRAKILNSIGSWAGDSATTPLCWLSGPAGTGKTTVAHTIAKECDGRGQLAATFFFWRKTGDRDDINRLVPTLAWQIAANIPSLMEGIEAALGLKDRPLAPLSELSLEDQLSKVFIDGCVKNVNHSGCNIIIIDGLDECASQKGIRQLIGWLRNNKSPFRFLFTSRPEPHIETLFAPGLGGGRIDIQSFSLTESKRDIRKYFVEELEKVWPKQQRLKYNGPAEWPSESDLSQLVEQSEGLFVYAATAIRYIRGGDYPDMLLKKVLKIHDGMDSLYAQVIKDARTGEIFDIVMGIIMYLRYPLTVNELSMVLPSVGNRLESLAVHWTLHRCHSLLVVHGDDTEIELYHASLRDFLTDQSRSKDLCYTPTISHAQLMVGCLGAITRAFDEGSHPPRYAVTSWFHHACLFLSAPGARQGVGRLEEQAKFLIRRIDLKWVKMWIGEALQWEWVIHFKGDLPSKQHVLNGEWGGQLEQKLRGIGGILKLITWQSVCILRRQVAVLDTS